MIILQDSANPEPEAVPLNQGVNKEKDTRSSFGENLRYDNDMPSSKIKPPADGQTNVPQSNLKVPRQNQISNEINRSTKVQKPAAVESTAAQSNPGMKTRSHYRSNILWFEGYGLVHAFAAKRQFYFTNGNISGWLCYTDLTEVIKVTSLSPSPTPLPQKINK